MTRPRPPFARLAAIAAAATALAILSSGVAQAKVKATLSGQILKVQGGKGSDRVTVICNAQGLVKVNGKDPARAQIACSRVAEVDALMGEGNDRVNFAGVDSRFAQKDFSGFGHGTGAAADLGPGDDRYVGSATAFNLVLAGTGSDSATGGALRDSLEGGSDDDTLSGLGGRDLMLGNAGNDTLNGGADDDLLSGNAGDDLLRGGAGADLLGGGRGMDRLFGGPGPDELIGGAGKDRLNGGAGHNTLIQDSPQKGK